LHFSRAREDRTLFLQRIIGTGFRPPRLNDGGNILLFVQDFESLQVLQLNLVILCCSKKASAKTSTTPNDVSMRVIFFTVQLLLTQMRDLEAQITMVALFLSSLIIEYYTMGHVYCSAATSDSLTPRCSQRNSDFNQVGLARHDVLPLELGSTLVSLSHLIEWSTKES
jgi:hypothetical protein